MAFVLKDGQGTLFKNAKDGVETRPDYRGEVCIDGTTYQLAGWLKEGKNGKWMSLSAKVKEEREALRERVTNPVDDDIPF